MRHIVVGVSWNARAEPVLQDNLVMAAVLCDEVNKAVSAEHFVFFNQSTSPDLSVSQWRRRSPVTRSRWKIDLPDVPPEVFRIALVLYVNEGTAARRTLGQLRQLAVGSRCDRQP